MCWQFLSHRVFLSLSILALIATWGFDEAHGISLSPTSEAVNSKEEEILIEAAVWSGWTPSISEALRLTVVSGEIDGETLIFGCIRDAEGFAMAFIDSTSDSPLVTVLWFPLQKFPGGMVSLWSDGRCRFVEIRDRNQEAFGHRVPWLSSAVPVIPQGLLKVSDSIQDEFLHQAAREFSRFLALDKTELDGTNRWAVRETGVIPKFVDERLDLIEGRFLELRAQSVAIAVASEGPSAD